MKTHTHTHIPGPWRIIKTPDGCTEVWQKTPICAMAYYPDYPGRQNAPEADARLIASAPDLLAALEQVYAQLGTHHNFDVSDLRLKVVKTAIAKAKGTP